MMATDRDQQRRLLPQAAGRQHVPAYLRVAECGREIGPRHAERRDFDIRQPKPGKTLPQHRIGHNRGIITIVEPAKIRPEPAEHPVHPFGAQGATQKGLRVDRDGIRMQEEDARRRPGQRAASQPPRQGEDPSTRSGASWSNIRQTSAARQNMR